MSCLDCVIDRTKRRRMLMVWGREGKPASQRRCVQLKAARLTWCGLLGPVTAEFFILFLFLRVFFPLSSQDEASRGVCDDRPSVPAVLSDKKMDSSNVGNHNKVKVMATQLLAKFEENAPAPQTGLKRQVRAPSFRRSPQFLVDERLDLKQRGLQSHDGGGGG